MYPIFSGNKGFDCHWTRFLNINVTSSLRWSHNGCKICDLSNKNRDGPVVYRYTYFSPKPCRCCPMRRITSSSAWDRRFFFFRVPEPVPEAPEAEPALLWRPLASPFCALAGWFCSCPVPFDCMLVPVRLRWVADRRPAEAPGSPTSSAAEARCFFRGGGDAPPVSESEEEEAEARVSSPRAAVVRSRWSPGEGKEVSGSRCPERVLCEARSFVLLFLSKQLQI